MVIVDIAKTPMGKVKPHQPMLKGNFEREMEATAKNSHTKPNPHMMIATPKSIT